MKFTDLDLDHKRELLLSFRTQNALAFELVEKTGVPIEVLIAHVTERILPDVRDLSDEDVNSFVWRIEQMFDACRKQVRQ